MNQVKLQTSIGVNPIAFFYWFHLQLEKYKINKGDLALVTGLSRSTIKNANLKNSMPKMTTIIIICEGINILNEGSRDDFITLTQEALETIPEYQYAINSLEKKQ